MRLAYATDQPLPRTATDAEQLVSMASALGTAGAEVMLLVPRHYTRPDATAEEVAAFYEVPATFGIAPLPGLTPSFRGLEKVAHGFAVARSPWVRGADVVYTRNLPTVLAAVRRGGAPVVYETYRPWPRQDRSKAPLFRWLFRHPCFLGAVLHSDLAAESYREVGAREEQLLVSHNGFNPRRLEPVLDAATARARLGLPANGPLAVYSGHVSMDKGLGLVLEMAHRLPDATFVLVGSKGRGEVERRAEALSNVHVVPWQAFSETVRYLYAADVLLIPPTRGPLERVGNTVLPMKTFLYMAAERAILGPATPDLQEVLADGETARLVPPDDLDAATDALRGLFADTEGRGRLAAAARQHVRTWAERGEEVLAFIEERRRACAGA